MDLFKRIAGNVLLTFPRSVLWPLMRFEGMRMTEPAKLGTMFVGVQFGTVFVV